MTDNAIPQPRYSLWQTLGLCLRLAQRALDEVRALKAAPPPAASFPIVQAFSDGSVHYAGTVVTHEGATWQALHDTGRAPPHNDWQCLAARGSAGPTISICGTYNPGRRYAALDVVM